MTDLTPPINGTSAYELLAIGSPAGCYRALVWGKVISGVDRRPVGEIVVPARVEATEANADGDIATHLADPRPLPRSLEDVQAELLALAAERRWEVETGGLSVDGLEVRTDRESQAQLGNAYLFSQRNPDAPVRWKGADGQWGFVTPTAVAAMVDIVGAHVQRCFAREGALADQVKAATTVLAAEALRADIQAFSLE